MFWRLAFCLFLAFVQGRAPVQGFFLRPTRVQEVDGRLTPPRTGVLSSAKQIVNSFATFQSNILHAIAGTAKQALDFGATLVSGVPVIGNAVQCGTNAMKSVVDAGNSIGQVKISFFQNLENTKLSIIEKLLNPSGNHFPATTTTTTASTTTTTSTTPTPGTAQTPATSPTTAPTPATSPTTAPTPATSPTTAPTPATSPTTAPTPVTSPTTAPTPVTSPTTAPTPVTSPTTTPTPATSPTTAPIPDTTAPTIQSS